MKKLFGTDGMRSTANVEPMTVETITQLGRAAAHLFGDKPGRHRILIAKDTRRSGYMVEYALTAGICSMGVDVMLVGPVPTPAVAFLVKSLRADAAAMISASHNPFQDNGIKFFSREGIKLSDSMEAEIERLMDTGEIANVRPTGNGIGKVFRIDDVEGRYIEFVKNSIPKNMDFQGIRVVVDCANGAAYKVAPAVLRELGTDLVVIGNTPNGSNINQKCGALYPSNLQKMVLKCSANLGIAYDGDADRVIFVDELGNIIHGDTLLVIFALDLFRQNNLNKNTLVTTIMSTLSVEHILRKSGIAVVRTKVGDRYVLEEMLRGGYNLGGEPSGHVMFLNHNTSGDGMVTTMQFLSLLKRTGEPVSKIASCMVPFPQIIENVRVTRRPPLSDMPGLSAAIMACEEKLKGSGRVLVRYSGTEPLLRIMLEGEDATLMSQMAKELAEIASQSV